MADKKYDYKTAPRVRNICSSCGEDCENTDWRCRNCLNKRGLMRRKSCVKHELSVKQLFDKGYLQQYPMLIEDREEGDIL